MKIIFEDKSYIEFKKSNSENKLFITIQAKDQENRLKKITNSVEITVDQLNKLLSEINN